VTYSWYFGQTFIDSCKEALIIEVLDSCGDLTDFCLAPYSWILA